MGIGSKYLFHLAISEAVVLVLVVLRIEDVDLGGMSSWAQDPTSCVSIVVVVLAVWPVF